jgi:predicted metalloprotease
VKWDEMRESANVDDRRGASPSRMGGLRLGGAGGFGLGGLLILLLVSWLFGVDPRSLLSPDSGEIGQAPLDAPAPGAPPANDAASRLARSVLGDTEDTWTSLFASDGRRYSPPTMVLFSDEVDSACGFASAAAGPFYCPRDHKLYLDLSFFNELDRRFGAPGDFAQAYVIAHEVGHHVQNLLGALAPAGSNAQSVRQELQADCLAGMWGRSAASRDKLDTGDIEEGLAAAAAVGDDRLQRAAQGRVVPESFTHGSSAQRASAFRRGLDSTTFGGCGLTGR